MNDKHLTYKTRIKDKTYRQFGLLQPKLIFVRIALKIDFNMINLEIIRNRPFGRLCYRQLFYKL